jgi:hypothetical protein
MPRTAQVSSQSIFQSDLSAHMLGVSKARLRFDWYLLAIVAGALLAFAITAITNALF